MDHDGSGGDFTFAVLRRLPGVGDGVLHGGASRIKAPLLYPLFGRPRSPPCHRDTEAEPTTAPTATTLLRRLLLVDYRGSASTSCHCPPCPGSLACCWKSGSTGSAVLRWRQPLVGVRRSHSCDGKEKFVFLGDASPSAAEPKGKSSGSAHALSWYAKRGGGGGGGKDDGRRRTFLPYRQDLIGLFGYTTAFRRSYHPF